jgi:hypothetical protein
MTTFRLVPLTVHGALEMTIGFGLMVLPFALGLGAAAIVVGVVVGALLVGAGLGASEPRYVPIGAHHAFDYGIAVGLLLCAAAMAIGDGAIAGALFLAAGALQLALNLITRYSLAT